MMNYRQMERHFQLLQMIDKFRQYIRDERSGGLRAAQYDGMSRANYYKTDRIGETVASLEKMQKKLKLLEERENLERPDVKATIEALTAGSGKNRIRTELIFTMHYLNGRTLEEIADILRIKPAWVENTIMKCFDRFEEKQDERS